MCCEQTFNARPLTYYHGHNSILLWGTKRGSQGTKDPQHGTETQLRLSQGTMTQKPEITIEIKTENN